MTIPFDVLPATPSPSDPRERGPSGPSRPDRRDDRFGGLLRDAVRDRVGERGAPADRDRSGVPARGTDGTIGRDRADRVRDERSAPSRPIHEALRLLIAGQQPAEVRAALDDARAGLDGELAEEMGELLDAAASLVDDTTGDPDTLVGELVEQLVPVVPGDDEQPIEGSDAVDQVLDEGQVGTSDGELSGPVVTADDVVAGPAPDADLEDADVTGADAEANTHENRAGGRGTAEERLTGLDRARQVAADRAAVNGRALGAERAAAGEAMRAAAGVDTEVRTDAITGARVVAGAGEPTAPIGAESLRASSARSSLPAAANVQRVLDALELLEQTPPPRQLTIELGEARLRIGLEDGQVRLTLLGERNDALARWLEETRLELTERGFDLFADGDETPADAGEANADPDRPAPTDAADLPASAPTAPLDDALRL